MSILGNLAREEATQRAALLGDVTYTISLDVAADPAAATYRSQTRIEFECREEGDTFLDLHARAVLDLELDGANAQPEFDDNRLFLRALTPGRHAVTVTADCSYQNNGVGLHRTVDPTDGEVYLYTQFEPYDAHLVFPCFDQPDLKARFTVTVTAPAEWVVVSNSPVRSREETAGRATTAFEPTPPISPYLMALVCGPYHEVHSEHRGIPLGLYCRRSLAEHLDAEELFTITRQGLDFYADFFGMAYPFAKYDQLFVAEFNFGAMENPGCVTFNDDLLFRSKVTETTRSRRADTVLHEMAHMWFGDLVTMRWWDDLWLNESFATYMAAQASDRATRFTDAWVSFASSTKAWAALQDQLPSTHPIAADMVDTEAVRLNFDGITYAKGASVLRQLVAFVGDDAFRSGLRTYMRRFQWSNASLADLLECLEEASHRNLGEWATLWLQTTGPSILGIDVERRGDALAQVAVSQRRPVTGDLLLRPHRLDLGLYDRSGNALVHRQSVALELSGERLVVEELHGVQAPDLLLLNDGDLTYAKIRLDPESIAAVTAPGRISAALPRALAGGYLWDMTRDGEMRTSDYVEFFVNHAPAETEISELERLISQVCGAVNLYAAEHNRLPLRERIQQVAQATLRETEPGSDRQLLWARCRIATSDTDHDRDTIATWLDRDEVDGLHIDTDLRWAIVQRLAASGHSAADTLVEAEHDRDRSDSGRRRWAAARAARPTEAAKRDAWTLATGDGGEPLQVRRAAAHAFHQPGQDDLLRAYVDEYATAVPELWRRLPLEEAMRISEGLYPGYLVDAPVVAMADRLLADTTLPPPARRIVAEHRDQTLRAQRARRADAQEGAPAGVA